MKKVGILSLLLCPLFTLAVLFTVSFHEVHYIFVDHYEHEHCHNHLHSADEHGHCNVCKFNIGIFTNDVLKTTASKQQFINIPFVLKENIVLELSRQFTFLLRGPPTLA